MQNVMLMHAGLMKRQVQVWTVMRTHCPHMSGRRCQREHCPTEKSDSKAFDRKLLIVPPAADFEESFKLTGADGPDMSRQRFHLVIGRPVTYQI